MHKYLFSGLIYKVHLHTRNEFTNFMVILWALPDDISIYKYKNKRLRIVVYFNFLLGTVSIYGCVSVSVLYFMHLIVNFLVVALSTPLDRCATIMNTVCTAPCVILRAVRMQLRRMKSIWSHTVSLRRTKRMETMPTTTARIQNSDSDNM